MRYLTSIETADLAKRGCDKTERNARRFLAGAVAGVALMAGANWASAAGAVSTPDSYFPIGVWSQPLNTFDKWQSRGINTVINYEPYGGQDSIDAWSNAANAHSFYQVRTPRPNPADDLKETRLLAWMHSDEPDIHKTSPTVLTNEYNAWKAIDPAKPVLVNFSGGELLNHTTSKIFIRSQAGAGRTGSTTARPSPIARRKEWQSKAIPISPAASRSGRSSRPAPRSSRGFPTAAA